jgi:uncharacterized protein YkwD
MSGPPARARLFARLARMAVATGVLALVMLPTQSTAIDRAAAEREMILLTNSDRTSNGLPSLRPNEPLAGVARSRSEDMATRNYFSHEIPPDGIYFEALLPAAGIEYRLAGENIARNNAPDAEAVRRAQTGFLNSPPHRANIMEPRYREIGTGVWDRPDRMKYFTVLFLQPPGEGAAASPAGRLAGVPASGRGAPSVGGLVAALLGAVPVAHAQGGGLIEESPPVSEGSGRRAGAPEDAPAPARPPTRPPGQVIAGQPAQLGLLDGIITRVLKLYLSA